MNIVGSAAHKIFGHIELDLSFSAEPVDDLADLGHDFGADTVARKDEDRESFLRTRGFSRPETEKIIATVLEEEGRPPESIFDFVQGITAVARSKPQQDARLVMEGKAKGLLENAK